MLYDLRDPPYNLSNDGYDQGDQNCEDTEPRSNDFHTWQQVQISEDTDSNYNNLDFAGENNRCVDENLNIVKCFKNLDYIFNPIPEFFIPP